MIKKIFIIILLVICIILFTDKCDIKINYEIQNNDVVKQTENGVKLKTIDDNTHKLILDPNDIRVCVNKQNALSSDYEPQDLVQLNIRFLNADFLARLRNEAAINLEKMFKQAENEGIYLYGVSGYRSYSYQQEIYEPGNNYSAAPGMSEHQSGLSIDLSNESIGCNLIEEFGESPEGVWLKNNSYKYGFIIRYPKDKENVTGYPYEPWHIRYVGNELALKLTELNLTMEEYFYK